MEVNRSVVFGPLDVGVVFRCEGHPNPVRWRGFGAILPVDVMAWESDLTLYAGVETFVHLIIQDLFIIFVRLFSHRPRS